MPIYKGDSHMFENSRKQHYRFPMVLSAHSANSESMMDAPSSSAADDPAVQARYRRACELFGSEPLSSEAISLLRSNIEKGCTSSMVRLGVAFADGDEA